MGTALGDGYDVVDFLHGSQPTLFQTLLAQRMLRSIPVTDTLPRSAVGFIDVRVTLIPAVLLPCRLSVFFTVLSVTKIGTAGVGTRSPGSARHLVTSVPGKRKALAGLVYPVKACGLFSLFADYIIA